MRTTVEESELKKKILRACMEKQRLLIGDFKARINSLTKTEGLGNEESYDNSELAGEQSKIAEINTLNALLEFANREMELLENMKLMPTVIQEKAVLGAVVVTTLNTFFISASIEFVEVEGQRYFGISTHSPLFLAMSGKAKGDNFAYKGKHYQINDIF
jgi:hypothetical protein